MSIPYMTRWRSALERAHLDHRLLTPLEHSVAVAFARYANSDGTNVLASHGTVAQSLGVHTKTVSAAVRKLERLGFLRKVKRATGGRGHTESAGEYACTLPAETGSLATPSLEASRTGNPAAGQPAPKGPKQGTNWEQTGSLQTPLPTGPTEPTKKNHVDPSDRRGQSRASRSHGLSTDLQAEITAALEGHEDSEWYGGKGRCLYVTDVSALLNEVGTRLVESGRVTDPTAYLRPIVRKANYPEAMKAALVNVYYLAEAS